MKWILILFFFLTTSLVHARGISEGEHAKSVKKIVEQWERHGELIARFNSLSIDEKEKNYVLLEKSIACCQKAIELCDYILEGIAKIVKVIRHNAYWTKAKEDREKDRKNLKAEIKNIQNLIDQTRKEIAFSKAQTHFNQSQERANLALHKSQNFPPMQLNNIEEVVNALNEIARLYEEAFHQASGALSLIGPYPDEKSKEVFHQSINIYQQAAAKFKQDAIDWPAVVEREFTLAKEHIATLKEELRILAEKGLNRYEYEAKKQLITVLDFLIANLPGESSGFEEERSQLKAALEEFEKKAKANVSSDQDVSALEKQNRDLFYKSEFLLRPERFVQNILAKSSRPCSAPR